MDHLFNSVVRVERMALQVDEGVATMSYVQATDPDPVTNDLLAYLPCRLDLNFIRPGKDALPAPVAGRAPDRVGLLITQPYAPLKAGDMVVAIPNAAGKLPVKGTFEIRVMPDETIGFSDQHHIEVQIIETGQELNTENWPSEDPIEDEWS